MQGVGNDRAQSLQLVVAPHRFEQQAHELASSRRRSGGTVGPSELEGATARLLEELVERFRLGEAPGAAGGESARVQRDLGKGLSTRVAENQAPRKLRLLERLQQPGQPEDVEVAYQRGGRRVKANRECCDRRR